MASLLAHALALNQHHSGHILDKGIAEIITLARVEQQVMRKRGAVYTHGHR